jgi:hypothetical protein
MGTRKHAWRLDQLIHHLMHDVVGAYMRSRQDRRAGMCMSHLCARIFGFKTNLS